MTTRALALVIASVLIASLGCRGETETSVIQPVGQVRGPTRVEARVEPSPEEMSRDEPEGCDLAFAVLPVYPGPLDIRISGVFADTDGHACARFLTAPRRDLRYQVLRQDGGLAFDVVEIRGAREQSFDDSTVERWHACATSPVTDPPYLSVVLGTPKGLSLRSTGFVQAPPTEVPVGDFAVELSEMQETLPASRWYPQVRHEFDVVANARCTSVILIARSFSAGHGELVGARLRVLQLSGARQATDLDLTFDRPGSCESVEVGGIADLDGDGHVDLVLLNCWDFGGKHAVIKQGGKWFYVPSGWGFPC